MNVYRYTTVLFLTENIECPGSYLCDVSNDLTEPRKCVPEDTVCDGHRDCPMGDDEIMCGKTIIDIVS